MWEIVGPLWLLGYPLWRVPEAALEQPCSQRRGRSWWAQRESSWAGGWRQLGAECDQCDPLQKQTSAFQQRGKRFRKKLFNYYLSRSYTLTPQEHTLVSLFEGWGGGGHASNLPEICTGIRGIRGVCVCWGGWGGEEKKGEKKGIQIQI